MRFFYIYTLNYETSDLCHSRATPRQRRGSANAGPGENACLPVGRGIQIYLKNKTWIPGLSLPAGRQARELVLAPDAGNDKLG